VLICIDKTTGSHLALESTKLFVVNILSTGQKELSERFASMIENKFEGVDFDTNVDGSTACRFFTAAWPRSNAALPPLTIEATIPSSSARWKRQLSATATRYSTSAATTARSRRRNLF
jgi:hypothetical protein